MFHRSRRPAKPFARLLAACVLSGLLACLAVLVATRMGVLSPERWPAGWLAVFAAALAVLGTLWWLRGRRAEGHELYASELSTLAFPPESRRDRPGLHRSR